MVRDRTPRRLVVVLHADVAGYSSLMEQDEDLTHKRVNEAFDRLDVLICRYAGSVVEKRGDALLAEFAQPSDALGAALAFQRDAGHWTEALGDDIRPRMRIGINLGEVIADRGTLWGSGVNLAQRVEQLAPEGEVAISDTVFNAVSKSLPVDYADLGQHRVKESLIRAYVAALRPDEEIPPVSHEAIEANLETGLADKPSIAVLPFTTMSADSEQEFFADGLVEDIITALSKLSGIIVIARNSSFVFKGRSVDVRQVAKELNVDYVLEGSVRKSGDCIRITTQLIDAASGVHVWGERYDRSIGDIFAVQDEITLIVATEMQVNLTEGEQARLRYSATTNIEAWTYWMQGMSYYRRAVVTKEDFGRARPCWEKALALDPGSATVNAMLGFMCYADARFGWWDDRQTAIEKGRAYVREALKLDAENADAYMVSSLLLMVQMRHEEAVADARRAIQLAPGSADAATFASFVLAWSGFPEQALQQIEKAMVLSPKYPPSYLGHLGNANRLCGRFDEAIAALKAYGQRSPGMGLPDLVITYVQKGDAAAARQAAKELLAARPGFTVESWRNAQFRSDPALLDAESAALRKAGLPLD